MGMKEHCLPFPRGRTYSDGGVVTMTDTFKSDLEGRCFTVPDTVNGTGLEVTLRVVKNDTGAAITVARDLARFSTTDAKDFGRRIGTFPNTTAGGIAKPLDDAYTVGATIPDDDLFYIVDEGPCQIHTEASSVSLAAQDAVASDASGRINGAVAAAGEYVVGVIDAASVATSTAVLVYVAGGLTNSEA